MCDSRDVSIEQFLKIIYLTLCSRPLKVSDVFSESIVRIKYSSVPDATSGPKLKAGCLKGKKTKPSTVAQCVCFKSQHILDTSENGNLACNKYRGLGYNVSTLFLFMFRIYEICMRT